ncbi:MAG: hypothetical protein AAFQ27_03455 [Pseudomonadota bacterium]
MSSLSLSERTPFHPVFQPDGDSMFEPKWFVAGFAVCAVALIANYDIRFGIAASALLLVVGAIYLWISVWLASDPDAPKAERETMSKRFSRFARNRRQAQVKELSAQDGSNAG